MGWWSALSSLFSPIIDWGSSLFMGAGAPAAEAAGYAGQTGGSLWNALGAGLGTLGSAAAANPWQAIGTAGQLGMLGLSTASALSQPRMPRLPDPSALGFGNIGDPASGRVSAPTPEAMRKQLQTRGVYSGGAIAPESLESLYSYDPSFFMLMGR